MQAPGVRNEGHRHGNSPHWPHGGHGACVHGRAWWGGGCAWSLYLRGRCFVWGPSALVSLKHHRRVGSQTRYFAVHTSSFSEQVWKALRAERNLGSL